MGRLAYLKNILSISFLYYYYFTSTYPGRYQFQQSQLTNTNRSSPNRVCCQCFLTSSKWNPLYFLYKYIKKNFKQFFCFVLFSLNILSGFKSVFSLKINKKIKIIFFLYPQHRILAIFYFYIKKNRPNKQKKEEKKKRENALETQNRLKILFYFV